MLQYLRTLDRRYLDAGCDTVTFHVEVEEEKEPTLRAIRAAGRRAGLALRPGTPLASLVPYAPLLDIVMVMTVEPGIYIPAGTKGVPKRYANIGIRIPAGDERHEERARTIVPRDILATSVMPHMHLLGVEMRVTATAKRARATGCTTSSSH